MLLESTHLAQFMSMELAMIAMHGADFGTCEHCGAIFLTGPLTGQRSHAKYCSDRCRVSVMRARQCCKVSNLGSAPLCQSASGNGFGKDRSVRLGLLSYTDQGGHRQHRIETKKATKDWAASLRIEVNDGNRVADAASVTGHARRGTCGSRAQKHRTLSARRWNSTSSTTCRTLFIHGPHQVIKANSARGSRLCRQAS